MKIHKILIFISLGFLLQSCEDIPESPYPDVVFKAQAAMPGNGRSSAVGFAVNGKGYVALGRNAHFLNDCWEFNPDSDKWTRKADFPGVARVKAMAAVVNDKAYVGLGFENVPVYQNMGYLHDFWMFDPVTNSWTRKKDFPGNSVDACVSFVHKNDIYVGSGFDGSAGFRPDFWRYNPIEDTWTQLSDFPGDSRSGGVICTNGERVFFGTGYETFCTNDWWEYFPASDSWKKLKSMPGSRTNAVAMCVNNRFFVSTGRFFAGTLTGGHVKSDLLEYDAVNNVWYIRGSIPNGSRENAVTFTIKDKAYIGFGENDETVLNDLWSFEP